jgi:hypothetical protein
LRLPPCFAYFHSIASYRIIFWGNSSYSKKIFTLEKRIIRIMVSAHPRTSCRRLFKKLEIFTVPSQYIYLLMSFFIGNQEKFHTNSSVHNINTRNKHHLHRPVASLSCFQKGASYSGIRIFNSLPRSITDLKNEKTQFKVALKKFLNAHSFYSVDELFTCADDMYYWLYDCVNVPYTVIFLLFVCLWHVPHPIVLWLSRIYGMYVHMQKRFSLFCDVTMCCMIVTDMKEQLISPIFKGLLLLDSWRWNQ